MYVYDPHRDDPRDWDTLGTICIQPNRYFDGHDQDIIEFNPNKYPYWSDLEAMLTKKGYVFKTIYAYIHGNVSLSFSNKGYPFNCRFDTSKAGFMVAHKSKIKAQFHTKAITDEILDSVYATFDNELKEYDLFLNGLVEVPDNII